VFCSPFYDKIVYCELIGQASISRARWKWAFTVLRNPKLTTAKTADYITPHITPCQIQATVSLKVSGKSGQV